MSNLDNFSVYADAELCKGCRKCELACIASHNNMTIKEAVKERKNLEPRVHVVKSGDIKMPVQCRHCNPAPCAGVCPTGAILQDERGVLFIRTEYCAGCGVCVMTCPYGAISLADVKLTEEEQAGLERGKPHKVAVSCDLCRDWMAREGKSVTACMEACPAGVFHLIPSGELQKALGEGLQPLLHE